MQQRHYWAGKVNTSEMEIRYQHSTMPCHGVLWRLDISAPYHIIPWCGIPYDSTVHHTMDHVPWCAIPQHTTTWSQQQPHPQLDQPPLWSCHELHLVEAITLQICPKNTNTNKDKVTNTNRDEDTNINMDMIANTSENSKIRPSSVGCAQINCIQMKSF